MLRNQVTEKGLSAPHIARMNQTVPQFKPQLTKGGRWFVAVATGNGPDSHIGDFETEAQAKNWISTKSKYWPGKPDAPKSEVADSGGLTSRTA
jgi:hypothetical protein